MHTFSEILACRICGGTRLERIISLGDQYLTGVFPKSPDERITCGPLDLVKCKEGCGLLQLGHSYVSEEIYGDNYGYRSGLNSSMVTHLKQKVASLMEFVQPEEGDAVLDIGSNDGTLLSFYPETLTRVGMDPTSGKFRDFYKPGIQVITDFFSANRFRNETGIGKVRIITSIAMFYDLDDPTEFVRQIADLLSPNGVWHFEQSYMPLMCEQNAYDTICHEHVSYYGVEQVKWMLDRCGLKILDVQLNDVNGGSFAVTAAKAESAFTPNEAAVNRVIASERAGGYDTSDVLFRFRDRVFEHRDQLREKIERLRNDGASILGYGASTKGNVILQFCGITTEMIPFMAEVNPSKFGCYTPGTRIPIISEADAHAMDPDYFLVMPWHFRSNLIQREQKYIQDGGKMLFPLPRIEVVG